MSEELLEMLKNSKKEDTLNVVLKLLEKVMSMMFALQSQNNMLEARIKTLELRGQPAPKMVDSTMTPLPPPPNPPKTPLIENNINTRNAIMGELKALFKTKKEVNIK